MSLRHIVAIVLFLTINSAHSQADSADFVTSWITDRSGLSSNDSLIIINTDPNYQYDFDIDWENDGVFDTLGVTATIEHVYDRIDTFTVRIRGQFPRPFFGWNPANSSKLHAIEQWGTTYWKNMSIAFAYGELIIRDSLPPRMDSVRNCSAMFKGSSVRGDFSSWNMSNVINMHSMFMNFDQAALNIENWDVSDVTEMSRMFMHADSFNTPIGNWNVSKVESMQGMFEQAALFNQPIGNWNVSSVRDMSQMFFTTGSFDQNIDNWNVSSVVNMRQMFMWSVFDQDINSWDVSNVQNMRFMFEASQFNGNIQDWDVSNVFDFRNMFSRASQFNQDISGWNTENAQLMSSMFANADRFNADIGAWDVSNVVSFFFMFREAETFNQDLSNWDVSAAFSMVSMFSGASSFNQNLHKWDITNLVNASNVFDSSAMSLINYDSTLIGWASQNINSNVELGAAGLIFCDADSARNSMINRGWSFIGDSLDCPVGLVEHDPETNFSIWPNPARGILNIRVATKRQVRLRILSLDGKTIFEDVIKRPLSQLDVSGLSKGIYIIQMGKQTQKMVIAGRF